MDKGDLTYCDECGFVDKKNKINPGEECLFCLGELKQKSSGTLDIPGLLPSEVANHNTLFISLNMMKKPDWHDEALEETPFVV